MNPTTEFECHRCGSQYKEKEKAVECCEPKEVYFCGECDAEHEDDKAAAETCCLDKECECTHGRESHYGDDHRGECMAFINTLIGDCPCMGFREI